MDPLFYPDFMRYFAQYAAKHDGSRSRGDRRHESNNKKHQARLQRQKMKRFNRTNPCGAKHRKAMATR